MAMCCHAAGETGPAPPNTIAVVLQVEDEASLLKVAQSFPEAKIFYESDEPYAGQAMSLGFLSSQGKIKAFSKLRLWRLNS